MTEQEYLAQYNINNFDRPSVTTDMILFTLDRTQKDIKKIDVNGLQVLLIRRNNHPDFGKWALPGGFCRPTESVLETAHRELQEETGIDTTLHLINTYSDQNRDPRGWIISNAYYGFVHKDDCTLRADTDAWDAKWFTLSHHTTKLLAQTQVYKKIKHYLTLSNEQDCCYLTVTEERFIQGYQTKRVFHQDIKTLAFDHDKKIKHYLTLSNEQDCCYLTVTEERFIQGYQTKRVFHQDIKTLAFDHDIILLETLLQVQSLATQDIRTIFPMLPETFTIGELQKAYECVLDEPVYNFRRLIRDLIIETPDTAKAGYRPARLYKRNFSTFLD